MIDACPVCRASYKNKPLCHRCKTDLTRFADIEGQIELGLAACEKHAADGDYGAMLQRAEKVNFLKNNDETRKNLSYAALLNGKFDLAWRLFKMRNTDHKL